MNSSFHKVIADLNISLRNPIDRGEGEQPHCYIRADELAALIQCATAIYGGHPHNMAEAMKAVQACDHD